MARSQNALIGRTSGSVGGITFSSWKDVNVIRTKPTDVSNPRTAKQTYQRAKVIVAIAMLRSILFIVRESFKSAAISMTAPNVFVSRMLRNLRSDSTGIFIDLPPAVSLSAGTLKPPVSSSFVINSPATYNITKISDVLEDGDNSDDVFCSAVINLSTLKITCYKTSLTRGGGGTATLKSEIWQASDYAFYTFYIAPDASNASQTFFDHNELMVP